MKKLFLIVFLLLFALSALARIRAGVPFTPDPNLYNLDIDYGVTGFYRLLEGGYIQHEDENSSFKWKVDFFLPEESPLIGLGPFQLWGSGIIHLKDISGTLYIPNLTTFEGMEQYPLIEKEGKWFRVVDDKKEMTLYTDWEMVTFLGINMFDPPTYGRFFRINNAEMNSATMFVPVTMRVWDYSSNYSTIYKLNEQTIFSHYYGVTTVIYYNETYKMLVQLGLGLITVFLIVLVLRWYKHIPAFNLKSKHFLVGLIICCLLMLQLAFVTPNPKSIQWEVYDLKPTYKQEVMPFYLAFIVGFTDSIDAIFVKAFYWCEKGVFDQHRRIYLPMKSARKIFVLNNLEDPNNCVDMIRNEFPWKTIELISPEEEEEKRKEMDDRGYPWGFLFDLNKRIIFILYLLVGFFAPAFLFLKAFEIKNIKQWIGFAIIIILSGFGLLFAIVITGFLAHMPVTYHGATLTPFTMSTRALPLIAQAHNVRLVILAFAIFFAFVFAKRIREKISIRIFFIPILIFAFLLTLPYTEFSFKRGLMGLACGNCGIHYSGRLDVINIQNVYAGLRGQGISSILFEEDREFLYTAERLEKELKRRDAIKAYKDFVANYPDSDLVFTAYVRIGELHRHFKENDSALEYFQKALQIADEKSTFAQLYPRIADTYDALGKFDEAISIYEKLAGLEENRSRKSYFTYRIGLIQEKKGDYEGAIETYKRMISEYPETRDAVFAKERMNKLTEGG